MSEVVQLFAPASADAVLTGCMGHFESVVVIGYDEDGEIAAHASKDVAQAVDVLWLVEAFKAKLLAGEFE